MLSLLRQSELRSDVWLALRQACLQRCTGEKAQHWRPAHWSSSSAGSSVAIPTNRNSIKENKGVKFWDLLWFWISEWMHFHSISWIFMEEMIQLVVKFLVTSQVSRLFLEKRSLGVCWRHIDRLRHPSVRDLQRVPLSRKMKRLQTAAAGDPSTDERRNHPLFVSVGYEQGGMSWCLPCAMGSGLKELSRRNRFAIRRPIRSSSSAFHSISTQWSYYT